MDLGPNIQLEGFTDLDAADIVITKKLVGNHVKKLSIQLPHFERLELHRKSLHGNKTELHGTLHWSGKSAHADVDDQNLFFAIDGCLKKLEHQAHQ
jgi:ribosome-associated translation inhibitor RaiA